jgi:hypothetical protein
MRVVHASANHAKAARYELGRSIATGGMGRVIEAFDRLGQRSVAYKRMSAPSADVRHIVMAHFQAEFETLKRLVHPNIVEVYEYGWDDVGPYYTMELLSGSDLTQLTPLSVPTACRVVRDVASALALVHGRGLVHRDLSPNNIRLTAAGRAKLIDFGALSKFGVPRALVGTAPFIAPEGLGHRALDQRADLYALGALLYFALTRRTHVPARTVAAMRGADALRVVRPSTWVSEIPSELDALIMALLQIDPLARPASAAEVIERLTSIAQLAAEDDEPAVARGYLQHSPLTGRGEHCAQLQASLQRVLSGVGQIVELHGERGAGRSALLDQFAIDAQLGGAIVLRAGGSADPEPFSAIRQMVRAGVAMFPDVSARSVAEEKSGERSLKSAVDASELQSAVASSLSDSLLELSSRAALALLIDDVDALDNESLALLAALCEPLRQRPIMLVLSTQAEHPVQRAQARARLAADAQQLSLQRLSEAELAELVSGVFGPVPHSAYLSRVLYARTGGNPGHALDLLRELVTKGAIQYTRGMFVLPHELAAELAASDYVDAQLARLSGVSTLCQQVAAMLALHVGALSAELLANLLQTSTPEMLRALDELRQRSVIAGDVDGLFCQGESLRAAIARTLSVAQRAQGHVALASALRAKHLHTLEGRLQVADHLIKAGGASAIEGAQLLNDAADEHRFQIAMRLEALLIFEAALVVLQRAGFSDRDCLGLLVPLSLAGFYGSLELQQKYLDRTLHALSSLCGLSWVQRLTAFIGPVPALYLGLSLGFVSHSLTRRGRTRRSFVDALQAFTSIVGPATGAAASVLDPVEAARIVRWLDPYLGAPNASGLFCIRELCVATVELGAGQTVASRARYERVLKVFEKPVAGVDEVLREQAILACMHGVAHALLSHGSGDVEALQLADQLEQRSKFYAPHAECIRMSHHAFRGDRKRATLHFQRAEALALRGGTAWIATVALCIRAAVCHVLAGDVVSLVRAVADLERFGSMAPTLVLLARLARAHLALLRGAIDTAISMYETLLESETARSLLTFPMDRALHARAVSLRGDHAAARALACAAIDHAARSGNDTDLATRTPRQELALIEARLGEFARARSLLDACFAHSRPSQNPLALGSLHRDSAIVALLARDLEGFAEHLAAMERWFRSTENPALIQQCDRLRLQSSLLGLSLSNAPAIQTLSDVDSPTVIWVGEARANGSAVAADCARASETRAKR